MSLIKNIVILIAIIVAATASGWGIVKAYHWTTDEQVPILERGDFSQILSLTDKPIAIFTTSTCPYCAMLREYLTENQLPVTEYVVDQNYQAAEIFSQLDAQSVPVLLVGDTRINGFDKQSIQQTLRAKNFLP